MTDVCTLFPPDAPVAVRRAFVLLWVSLLLGLVEVIYVALTPDPEIAGFMGVVVGATLVLAAIYAGLLWFAMHRRNWARILVVCWSGVGIALQVLLPAEGPTPWWDMLLMWLAIAMEVVAFYWLLTGAGGQWYRTRAAP